MFVQVINTTLRILFFRAGPQDFPYANGLTQVLVALAVAANALVFSRILPLAMSVAMAGAMVGAMALVTHSVLKARQMGNRFQQTFNALLATTAVLTLVLLPPFSQIAPQILQLAKNPELLTDPDAVKIPATAVSPRIFFVTPQASTSGSACSSHLLRRAWCCFWACWAARWGWCCWAVRPLFERYNCAPASDISLDNLL
jgi:hypothetical protein